MTGLMNKNSQQEEFSYAYIKAVASTAGFSVANESRVMDNAGIDLTIRSPGLIGQVMFPQFDAQVKCTSDEGIIKEEFINFPLKVHNYNQLVDTRPINPQILVVVIVPKDVDRWLNISEEQTLMKKCGYWLSLKGKNRMSNNSSVTVKISRKNLFTPQLLLEIMDKIGRYEEL